MSKRKVIITGCGGMSRVWIEACRKISSLDIAGLVDLNLESAEQQKIKFGLECQTSTSLSDLIQEVQADVVVDVTVPQAHVQVGLTALNAGCDLWSEKPMASTMDEARQLLEAAQKNNRVHAVMQNRRYLSTIQHFKRIITEGKIGKPSTWNVDFYLGARFSKRFAEGKHRDFRDRMEHVLLLDMAIHTFDMARCISGTDPVSVYCHEFNPAESWYDHGASAQCIFEMSDGSVLNYRGSWCAQGKRTSWESEWKVIGDQGSAHWNGHQDFQVHQSLNNDGLVQEAEAVELEPMTNLEHEGHAAWIGDVIRSMEEGVAPQTVGEDNIKSLAMVHGAIASSKTGRKVFIKDLLT